MTAQLDGIPANELRALIRDILRDIVPATNGRGTEPASVSNGRPPSGSPTTSAAVPATPPSSVPAGQPGRASQPEQAGEPPAATQPSAATYASARPRAPAGAGLAGRRPVRLETDADLRQFALDILRIADNPARRRDLLAGRLTFTLARRQDASPINDHRVEAGAVTERAVQSAAEAGQRIVLGPRAVLTPLARDRALALGVPIEKER